MKKRDVHTSAHIIFTYTTAFLLMVPAECFCVIRSQIVEREV